MPETVAVVVEAREGIGRVELADRAHAVAGASIRPLDPRELERWLLEGGFAAVDPGGLIHATALGLEVGHDLRDGLAP